MYTQKHLNALELKQIFEEITGELIQSGDPLALYNAVVQIAMKITEAQASSLYLEVDESESRKDETTIKMVAGAGYEKYRVGKARYRKGQGLTGWIWKESKSVKYDSAAEVRQKNGPWKGEFDAIVRENDPNWECWSLIGVPLNLGNRTIGVLKVENKKPGKDHHFSIENQMILEVMASTIALAIESRRSSEKLSKDILTALNRISDLLVGYHFTSFYAFCNQIVSTCVETFNAQAGSLYLETSSEEGVERDPVVKMVAGAGYEIHRMGAEYLKGQGLTGWIWENAESVKFDSQEALEKSGVWRGVHDSAISKTNPNWECSSLIAAPLRIGSRTIGVLKVENKQPSPQASFTFEELNTLKIMAGNIALNLEMQDRYRKLFWQGEFARDFAHDIRNMIKNPIYDIDTASHEIETGDRGKQSLVEVSKRLKNVRKSLLQVVDMTSKTLADPLRTHHRTRILINSMLKELKERVSPTIMAHHIKFQLSLPDEPIQVEVDEGQMFSAFQNLIMNSIDALVQEKNRRDPEINVIAERVKGSAVDSVIITIEDNGPGLSKDQIINFNVGANISSTKHRDPGSGLRQASRSCIDNGAQIRCHELAPTGKNGGAKFSISIPIFSARPMKILFIDDDEDYLEKIKDAAGSRKDVVHGEYLKSPTVLMDTKAREPGMRDEIVFKDLDWILLDCHYREHLDGPQILKYLEKKNPELADKVILMSGHPEFTDRKDIDVRDKYDEVLFVFDKFLSDMRIARSRS